MSIESLYPHAGVHAIQSAVFTVGWSEVLSEAELLNARGCIEGLQAVFPSLEEQKTLTVNLTDPGVHQATEFGGYVLSKKPLAAGISRNILVSKDSVQITVPDYSRWDSVKTEVLGYLAPLVAQFRRQIRMVGLQYQDSFHWRAEASTLNVSEIFSRDSKYLPGNVFLQPGMWHSHHGYFEFFQEPFAYRQLDNINVSRVDGGQPVIPTLDVLTSHRIDFANATSDESLQVFSSMLEKMHLKNKEILGDLLVEEVQVLIKLKEQIHV